MNDLDHKEFISPSKSQLKREAHALRDLGAELIKLSPEQLQHIPLSADLEQAVLQAQQMKKHGALRRQIQLIGKLLRQIDAEPIIAAFNNLQQGATISKQQQHWLEQTRAALIANEAGALDAVFARYPEAERQHLRHLIAKAQREQAQNKPPSASRALFRYLRELSQAQFD